MAKSKYNRESFVGICKPCGVEPFFVLSLAGLLSCMFVGWGIYHLSIHYLAWHAFLCAKRGWGKGRYALRYRVTH